MLITGTQTQSVQITISEQEVKRIVHEGEISNSTLLNKMYHNLAKEAVKNENAYINLEKGRWEHTYEIHGSHSYDHTDVLREATDKEIATYKAIKELSKLLHSK